MTAPSASLTPLIGRDDDIHAILDRLALSRLVTLTGPGGSGKTRLAQAILQSASNLGNEAWFVDCSAIDTAALIPQSIVAALNLSATAGTSVEHLIASRLAGRNALLILDNLEQIRDAGDPAALLLHELPQLTILAASRRPLGIDAEHEYPVGPLALPDAATPAAIEESAAGSLFLARARARAKGFQVDMDSAPDVVELLRRLDGLPLAIELAAARMRTMSPRELNERLDQVGPRGVDTTELDVRRSLRAIVDWTAGQLSAADFEVLEATTVCAGFDLALLGVLAPNRDVVPSLDALQSLGLVQRQELARGRSRFRVLLTIQAEIGARMTVERRATFRARHAQHFAGLARVWAERAERGDGPGVVAETDLDADNIRRALGFVEQEDPDRAAAMLVDLSPFFNARGRWAEAYDAFVRLRERTPRPTVDLVRAALVVADLIWHGTSFEALVDLQEWAITEAGRLGDQPLLEDALYYRAIIAAGYGDHERLAQLREAWDAQPPATDAGARLRRVNFEISLAQAAGHDLGRIEALMREAIEAFGGIDDDRSLWRVVGLAEVLFHQRRYQESERMARIAVTRYLDIGAEAYASWAIRSLSVILAEQGKADEARDVLLIGVSIVQRAGASISEDGMFWAGVAVAESLGLSRQAARYYGAWRRSEEEVGPASGGRVREAAERWFARASRGESAVAIELALREGAESDPRGLLDAMPSDLRPSKVPGVSNRREPAMRHGALTPREVEVLGLVGSGRSDGDIASELFISPKTASVHVSNVKAKLGVESRLELALRARDLGLVRSRPA